jgi:TetR/AcrR family transcriptional regulator, transcriptional repressor for nem operon
MTRRASDTTRELILQAAFEEIHRNGFQAASLNAILEHTGLTKGALYHHFPTKQALGLAVVDELIAPQFEVGIFAPLRESTQPIQAMLAQLDAHVAQIGPETVRLGCPLNNLMQEMSGIDPSFKARLEGLINQWRESVADALRRGQRQGVIRPDVDCQAAALFAIAAMEGCAGVAKTHQTLESYRACMTQLRGFLVGLMQAPASGSCTE